MNLLTERWQNTGLWGELCKKKVVVVEPKFSRDFEESIRHFYDAVETTTKFPNAVILLYFFREIIFRKIFAENDVTKKHKSN